MNDFNTIKISNRIFKYESFWRDPELQAKDYHNNSFPVPEYRMNPNWYMKDLFIEKLKKVENYLLTNKKFIKYTTAEQKHCLICDKLVATGLFTVNNIRWENSLIHYITVHNIKPSDPFIDLIFRLDNNPYIIASTKSTKIKGTTIIKHNKMYLKLHKNQIFIMDALMEHGSSRIYEHKNKALKYSEHAGLLDFTINGLEKILVYANTDIISKGDDEIFFPNTLTDAYDYEYIFHTHPATNSYGGRAKYGVLYELPSINDLFHFMDHYNDGKTQGSIIIAPEGMYIIRKYIQDNKKININENDFFNKIKNVLLSVQQKAIAKHGKEMNKDFFLNVVSKDFTTVNAINKVLHNFELHIDYFPRILEEGNWIIDTVYVPVYAIEPESESSQSL
jgi:hypothetical protein